ncbi:hypothetical protein [Cloacibacillus porcorum]|uniref:Uncharacterized protein n=1 Tax=Cloacibacillus porcorum TaxID=1197717 RepID=A0A1B2I6T6_9BACT|nr:hypothetical protein [Cloacibacillus porcorum]ANZ45698.1 hypothetical protein BED41_11795 [Cloacibacillus porcorum]
MSEKEAIINKKIVCKERTTIFSEKLVLGSLIFILSFVLLAYLLGNAEIVSNPLVPSRIF